MYLPEEVMTMMKKKHFEKNPRSRENWGPFYLTSAKQLSENGRRTLGYLIFPPLSGESPRSTFNVFDQ